MARSLKNLAVLYYFQGRTGEAERLFKETVALRKRLLGNEHPSLAVSLNNLARCYREMANYSRAQELCQEALAIDQKASPEDQQLRATS